MIAGVNTLRHETLSRLELIANADWHFADAKTQTGVHGIHPYPAKFIPQIPRQLIGFLADRSELCVFGSFLWIWNDARRSSGGRSPVGRRRSQPDRHVDRSCKDAAVGGANRRPGRRRV